MLLTEAKLRQRLFGSKSVQVFVAGECRFNDPNIVKVKRTRTGVRLWMFHNNCLAEYFFPVSEEIRIMPDE